MSPHETNAEQPLPFPLTDLDRTLLKQTDEEVDGDGLTANNFSVFKRKPSQLRLYIEWTRDIKTQYGSVVNFVCSKRLHWALKDGHEAITPRNPVPFADPSDYKILINDWPYGCTPDVTHLVVWLKTRFDVDSEGRLLPAAGAAMEAFVDRTFKQPLALVDASADRVLWFKNWTKLQSVRALEHFHIMVKDADQSLLMRWTEESSKKNI